MWLSESGTENPKSVWWNDEVKAALGERRLLEKRCWQLAMKGQKKEVWKRIEEEKN